MSERAETPTPTDVTPLELDTTQDEPIALSEAQTGDTILPQDEVPVGNGQTESDDLQSQLDVGLQALVFDPTWDLCMSPFIPSFDFGAGSDLSEHIWYPGVALQLHPTDG